MEHQSAKNNSRLLGLLGIGALSLALGIASGFLESGFQAGPAALHTFLIAATQALFFMVLPRRMSQPTQILLAMVLGVLSGWLMSRLGMSAFVTEYLGFFGTLFILLLKVVVIPLIFVSILCGVAGIGDAARLGRLGGKAVAYYLSTTCVAVLVGITVVTLLQPGTRVQGLDPSVAAEATAPDAADPWMSVGRRVQEQFLPRVIQNPIMAGQDTLVIIFFALLLGSALAMRREESAPVLAVLEGLNKAFIQIVLWVMMLAPIGVFALMAKAVSEMGINFLGGLAMYVLTVLLGLGLHWCILVFVLLGVILRVPPLRFIRGMAPALELSFSTSSSSATLPVTIDCATRRVGVDKDVAAFMLPIGATINMDGTALYLSVAAIFVAEIYGLGLNFGQELAIFLTAVAMSVGAAGIPGAALPLLAVVLMSVGLPAEGIGIVAGVDRFLDMCRTFLNVSGDAIGTVVVSKTEGTMRDPDELA